MKNDFVVLANDPSFTAWGWAIVDGCGSIVNTGCIKTEPEHKKRRIRKGDDTVRRISEINNELLRLIQYFNVKYILSELPHGSQNASAAVMIGVVTGIVQTISDTLKIPVEWYSEQDAKKNLVNKKAVTKKEMIDAVSKKWDVPWTGVKYKDEAVADALAIYLVAKKQSNVLMMLSK